jgi:hypothetical protein
MARRTKLAPSTSPNKVLVVFMVLFILTTIGEAVWAYTLLKDKDNWDKTAKEMELKKTAAEREQEWYKYQVAEVLAAIGDEGFFSKSENVKQWLVLREQFTANPPQRFIYKEDRDAFLKTIKTFDDLLGFSGTGYKAKLLELHKEPATELERMRGLYSKKLADANETIALHKSLESQVARDRKALEKMIDDYNKNKLVVRKTDFDATKQSFEKFDALTAQIEETDKQHRKALVEKDIEIKALKAKIEASEDVVKNPNRALMDPHALMLDVSRGKTLWDTPRGKIIRFDEGTKKVYIDKGSKDGIKVGLTFMVFGPGWKGRGEGPLKTTIEVVRVEDDHLSSCKINSYYDSEGREVAANDATPARVLRDGAYAIKDGDLLFNLTWGMHVAIVGIVDFTGVNASSPAAQKDSLDEFMIHLGRLGVIVDAYMDPRDGKMVGAASTKTNILIRGASPGDSKDKENPRYQEINNAIKLMHKQAVERGMFIISAENFAVVTGYRRPGSADNQQTLGFSPRPPFGASGLPGDANHMQEQPNGDAKKQ